MKRIQLKLEKIYCFEVNDDFDFTKEEDMCDAMVNYLGTNNMDASNEFYENLEIICSECGVSLNIDEEKEDGKCLQCGA